jgi:hypothetical protein
MTTQHKPCPHADCRACTEGECPSDDCIPCGIPNTAHALQHCLLLFQVPCDFRIDLSQLSRPTIIEASPMTGKIAAGDRAKVKLKVGCFPCVVVGQVLKPSSPRCWSPS